MNEMTAPQQAPPATTTVVSALADKPDDYIIDRYIKLRDKVDAIKKEHIAALAPYREMMATLENVMLARLIERGATNTRTNAGTAYVKEDVTVTVRGWSETLAFIQANELWELLEARVSKTAALEIAKERGEDIPGVVVRRENGVNIRRTT